MYRDSFWFESERKISITNGIFFCLIQEVFFRWVWNPEFEKEKYVIFYLYKSKNDIWECNNEGIGKVSLNYDLSFLHQQ